MYKPVNLFVKNIKRILKKKGLRQEDLARSLNKDASSITRFLRNERPRYDTIIQCAEALKVKPWEFFIDEEAEDIGPMSRDEIMLVLDFKEIVDPKKRNAILEMANGLAKAKRRA
jgi:transcriptional regulator with XRE-family HTH domain